MINISLHEDVNPDINKEFIIPVSTLKTILPKLSNNLDLSYTALKDNGKLKSLCFLSTRSPLTLTHTSNDELEQALQVKSHMERMIRENLY